MAKNAKKLFGAALKAHQKKERKKKAAKARKAKTKATKPKPKKKKGATVAKEKKPRRRRTSSTALKAAAYAIAGGASGAVMGHLLREQKVKAQTTSVALLATGVLGATTLKGNAKWFAAGVATSGASQFATAWAAKNLTRNASDGHTALSESPAIHLLNASRNQGDGDIQQAFAQAQSELEQEAA